MRQIALTRGALLTPFNLVEEATLLISGGKITAAGARDAITIPPDYHEVHLDGLLIAPGFIDQHLHGGGGAAVMDGTKESLLELARFHATHGTTGFLATTVSGTPEELRRVAQTYAAFINTEYKAARCLGLHLEGPYLAAKWAGVHPAATLRPPQLAEVELLNRISKNGVKLVTLAPELPGALELIRALAERKIAVAIGHSDSDYETALAAVQAGCSSVSHCFNRLRPFHHRDPGVLGAVLTCPELKVELIADRIHLHQAALQLAWQAKGSDGIILVTDALPKAQTVPVSGNTLFDQLPGSGISGSVSLAGSQLTMERAVKNFMELTGCELTDALKAATYNPACLLGLNKRKGSLYPGKDADLVVLTPDLEVMMTMVGGEVISGLIALD